jgi:hypothetical protein
MGHRFPGISVGLVKTDSSDRSPNRIAALLSWSFADGKNWSDAGWRAGMMRQLF